MLEIQNVSKTFNAGTVNEKTALNGLNLKLNEGDFVTVIGGNGAGKSTMLNAVAGVWPVDCGKIIIDGVDVTRLGEHQRAAYIGRVFQDPMTGTAATMQIEENLALAARRGKPRTLRIGITRAEREQYRELLKSLDLGLENRLTARVGLLSGGQRQALTLLMATMNKPKLLLLDEHTAALDPKTALKVLTLSHITDAFGDAPYFEAGKGYTEGKFYPAYDSQKEIYRDMFAKLELANELLAESKDFDALEDYMYDGKVAQWRKFGNSLYVRLLMRAALKDESDQAGERLDAVSKLNEIFSYPSVYPVFESRADAADVKFDANVNAQYTPFHNVRAGLWNANMICERLMDEMYDSSVGLKDPRASFYFDKLVGVPTQITYNELMGYFDTAGHYRRNVIQDRDHFPLMNYSELWFIWAEAAYRGWIPGTPKEYYVKAVSEAVYEWTDNPAADLTSFLSNSKVSLDALDGEEVLERIMTQKWISNFLVGIESWCDYRRTGYPRLMPATEDGNKSLGVVDSELGARRMPYPADEYTTNNVNVNNAVSSLLKGTDNMATRMWWDCNPAIK